MSVYEITIIFEYCNTCYYAITAYNESYTSDS